VGWVKIVAAAAWFRLFLAFAPLAPADGC